MEDVNDKSDFCPTRLFCMVNLSGTEDSSILIFRQRMTDIIEVGLSAGLLLVGLRADAENFFYVPFTAR